MYKQIELIESLQEITDEAGSEYGSYLIPYHNPFFAQYRSRDRETLSPTYTLCDGTGMYS